MKTEYKCICGRVFTKANAFNGHKSHCIIHQQSKGNIEQFEKDEYTRHQKMKNTMQTKAKDNYIVNQLLTKQLWLSEQHTCDCCGRLMIEKYGSGRFCSKSCANRRAHSNETKLKISSSIKKLVINHPEFFGFHNNLSEDPNCYSKFSSRRERELRDFLKEQFPDAGFTTGHFCDVYINNKRYMLNPDMYSHKYKLVIEYDGIWHFKDIHNQLDSKQFKDRLLFEWIKASDYSLIRIDEEYKISNTEFLDLIKTVLNSHTRQIILLGDRYSYLTDRA